MKKGNTPSPRIRRFRTDYSGTVEIVEDDGEVYLDTAHANYSYGTLQRILAVGLKDIDITSVRQVLLLGLGGGSVVKTLREAFDYAGQITAVELDKAMIGIAQHEFGLISDKKLNIIHGDALQVVSGMNTRFDLIIIDLFIHTQVPEVFYEPPFWIDIHRLLSKRGTFLFNASVGRKGMRALNDLKQMMGGHFQFRQLDGVEDANSLLLGTPKKQPI